MLSAFLVVLSTVTNNAVHFYVAGSDLERDGHLRPEGFEDAFGSPANHRIVRTGHTDIGDIGGPFGQNFFVGGRDVGMSSEDAAYPAVEVIAHRDFFAGGLGVKIDKDNIGLLR